LQVLTLFNNDRPEWTLNELSRQTGLGKTTTYRILRTMEAARFLVFKPETSAYHVGPAMFPASYLVQAQSEIARVARPFLEQVAQETGETAALAVEVDGVVVVADQVLTSHFFKPSSPIGRVLDDLGNANSKIFAAFKSEEERRAILASHHPQLTPHTITAPDDLSREFERIRRDGVAYDFEEQRLGVCAVGVPVLGPLGEVKATLTVVAPRERFDAEAMRLCTEVVRRIGASLSAYLGFPGYET
jgi:DNA-binding IclR family transcriptional regulator